MRVVIAREPIQGVLWWTHLLLFDIAAMLFSYCGFVVADTWMFQKEERRVFDQLLQSASVQHGKPPAPAGLIGRIEIDSLGVSAMVIEGTSDTTLRRAVGHISGTSLPGQRGNVGLSAHRDTFFRPLRNIRRNQVITIVTLEGEYRYRVLSTGVVSPRDVGVLDQGDGETLTLVTCYPFYFVGAAPNRFIVHAARIV